MLKRCYDAEYKKLHGAPVWIAFLIVPIFPAVLGTFNYTQNLGILDNDWYSLWTQNTLFYSIFFFGPLVALYCSYLWRLEHMGHNWNLIMSVPVRPIDLFLAKFLVVFKVALFTQGWVWVLFFIAGKIVGLPGFPPLTILFWLVRGAAGGCAIIALQLLLSMCIRSFAVPILIALGGSIAGMLASSGGYGLVWPYALMLMGMNANRSQDMLANDILPFAISVAAFTALFFVAANLLLTRRDVRAE